MSKDRKIKIGNMFGFDEGVDDEYFINEIIGIDEFTYEDFVKEEKDKSNDKWNLSLRNSLSEFGR